MRPRRDRRRAQGSPVPPASAHALEGHDQRLKVRPGRPVGERPRVRETACGGVRAGIRPPALVAASRRRQREAQEILDSARASGPPCPRACSPGRCRPLGQSPPRDGPAVVRPASGCRLPPSEPSAHVSTATPATLGHHRRFHSRSGPGCTLVTRIMAWFQGISNARASASRSRRTVAQSRLAWLAARWRSMKLSRFAPRRSTSSACAARTGPRAASPRSRRMAPIDVVSLIISIKVLVNVQDSESSLSSSTITN